MAGAHVTTVTSRTYRLPLPRPWGPEVTCQYLIATTVGSSDGGSGQGFSWAVRAGAQAIQAMVDADCRPVAEGGPVAPAAAWDRLWWHLREAGGGVTTLAMAAIDIGLWDLRARAAGLGAAIDIPVAAGESLYTEAQFRDVLLAGAVDYLQPNVCRVGGITPFLRIARLARLFGVPVMPHLLPEISGQLALCLPLPAMIEDIDEGSFAALGALAEPSGVVIAGDTLQA